MIMEPPFIIQDGVIGVVQLQQMLQGPRGLLRGRVDLVDLDGGDIDRVAAAREEVSVEGEGEREHG